jgi:hypothetical protein
VTNVTSTSSMVSKHELYLLLRHTVRRFFEYKRLPSAPTSE